MNSWLLYYDVHIVKDEDGAVPLCHSGHHSVAALANVWLLHYDVHFVREILTMMMMCLGVLSILLYHSPD